jgi:uncharacterized small protein (DUF1192 family)
MTIKQALKEKNRLIKAIDDEFKKVYSYNSIDEGNVRPYSTVDALSNIMTLEEGLIDLKTKIHRANIGVYDKIFRLSELKSLAKKLNQIDCSEGKVSDRYSRGESSIKTAELSIVERDVRVKSIEEEIERLQEELDNHNATTSI